MNPELMMLCLVGLGCAFVLGCIYFISRLLAQRQKRLMEEAELEESLAPPVAAESSPSASADVQPSGAAAPQDAVSTAVSSEPALRAETEAWPSDDEADPFAVEEPNPVEPRPSRRRRSRRRDEEDEEEPEFVVAKPMPLQAVREFSYECAGRAQYAFDEGAFVQAYYFALLSELNGHRQAADLMAHIRVVWRQCGYPEEGFSRQSGFSRTEYMLGLSALRIDAHFDAHYGYACLEDLSADGNDLAKVLLERRPHR